MNMHKGAVLAQLPAKLKKTTARYFAALLSYNALLTRLDRDDGLMLYVWQYKKS